MFQLIMVNKYFGCTFGLMVCGNSSSALWWWLIIDRSSGLGAIGGQPERREAQLTKLHKVYLPAMPENLISPQSNLKQTNYTYITVIGFD